MAVQTVSTRDTLEGPSPRYLQLARSLMADIESGRYPVGARLPTEPQLCRDFGASRHTVRAAIERIARLGLVTRRPRIGTVVRASRPAADGYRLAVGNIDDLLQFAQATRMRVVSHRLVQIDAGHDETLSDHVGQQWLRIEGVRSGETDVDGDRPMCLHEIWVAPDYRGVRGVEGVLAQSIFLMIAHQFQITIPRVQQDTRAIALSPSQARELRLPPGSPALWVRRQYFDSRDRLVEVSIGVYRGEDFTYRLTLQRDRPAVEGLR